MKIEILSPEPSQNPPKPVCPMWLELDHTKKGVHLYIRNGVGARQIVMKFDDRLRYTPIGFVAGNLPIEQTKHLGQLVEKKEILE